MSLAALFLVEMLFDAKFCPSTSGASCDGHVQAIWLEGGVKLSFGSARSAVYVCLSLCCLLTGYMVWCGLACMFVGRDARLGFVGFCWEF